MIKDTTKSIIERTLKSSFSKEQFLSFTRNLLNFIDEEKSFHAHGYIKEKFKKTADIVRTYERLGTYSDPNGKKIDILIVYLAKNNSIDRARTSLRNFVADYLKQRDQKDAALVAFVSPNFDDWRFSLVKMEYKFEENESGKVKVKEEFTPARRWSFLVGSKESSHTAQSRLAPIIEDDERNPTLEQLEEAFNIEKVTKEFFEKYRELFLRLKENLDSMREKDAKIDADFTKKDIDTVDFAKKLLGQIVFLYFLQKKGWFGVERDEDWGSGPKDFLRQLYNKKHGDYQNFFNEVLEPMFYEALARERDDDYYGRFNCKIPFLNGGLFDPIGDYDWVHTDINLDNEIFSNDRRTKQGDIGDGILDIFDRYNFTVREDEPLEKEVAVDPEMLGKVFENLLEVKDRKSKGTYYTPREIVHYMCEQSLINYLSTSLESKVRKEEIEEFIKIGEEVLENETWAVQKEDESASQIPRSIKNNAEFIDKKLADIKVCDPAIGSGAFPVGIMSEIVSARLSLNPFLCKSTSNIECFGRTVYDFKMHAITNSIYGVDIDPGAVEIAKLRLWLSLVVDENDIKNIKPLPNLDYKIMQGNSLLEEFDGIKLFDESIIPKEKDDIEERINKANLKINELQREFIKLHSQGKLSKSREQLLKLQLNEQKKIISESQKAPKQNGSIDLFGQADEIQKKWDELTQLHRQIVNETNRDRKREMLKRASELEWKFIEASLKKEGKLESLSKIEKFKKLNTKPFFLWHLHFADVFNQKSGFNVIIGNPPYGAELTREEKNTFKLLYGDVHVRTPDTFNYFISKSIKILSPVNGTISFIVSNNLLFQNEYFKTREIFLKQMQINSVLNLGDSVFENAIVPSCVFVVSLPKKDGTFFKYADFRKHNKVINDNNSSHNFQNYSTKVLLETPAMVFGISKNVVNILKKISEKSATVDSIVDEVACGISTGGDKIFRISRDQSVNLKLEKELLRKVVIGREMGKYYCKNTDHFIIYTSRETNIDDYPNIKKYLNEFKDRLEKRSESKAGILPWFALNRQRNPELFEGIKIIFRQTDDSIKATLEKNSYYSLDSTLILKLRTDCEYSYEYVLGILNSTLMNFIYQQFTQEGGRIFAQVKPQNIRKLFIPNADHNKQKEIIERVTKIFDNTKDINYFENCDKQARVKDCERQIDHIIYRIYNLSPEEINIVEGVDK